jgi:hypothetical protein
MKNTCSLALCISLAGACSGKTDSGAIDGGGEDSFEPASGAWDYSSFMEVSNSCGGPIVATQPPGGLTILNNGNGTFTVTPGDGDDPFECNISDSNYGCDDVSSIKEPNSTTMITESGGITGVFSSVSAATGARSIAFDCAGSGCASLEFAGTSFPCVIEVAYEVALTAAP